MPDPIATSDQDKAAANDLAVVVAAYFKGLLGEGLERVEALALAQDFQAEKLIAEREE